MGAERTRLGVRRSVHRPAALWRALLPAVVASILTIGIGLSFLTWTPAALPVALVCGGLIFPILAWTPLRGRGLIVEIHADGVVVITPKTRDAIVFEDIDELWFELDVRSLGLGAYARIEALRLVDHDRVVHRVPLIIDDAVGAANWILRHCSNRLLDDARRALRAGETLTFASVRIDQEGITFATGVTLAWKELRLARMQPGAIRLFRRMPLLPWRTIRLDRVPHPMLLTTLIRELAPRVEIDDPLQRNVS